MKIQKITIKNYKSIDSVDLPVDAVDGVRSFPYMGINEAGKTSILNAISFLNDSTPVKVDYDVDCFSASIGEPIEVSFLLEVTESEVNQFLEEIKDIYHITNSVSLGKVMVKVQYDETSTRTVDIEYPDFGEKITATKISYSVFNAKSEVVKEGLTKEQADAESLVEGQKIKKVSSEVEQDTTGEIAKLFTAFVKNRIPKAVLWRSEPKYLIPDEIKISEFIANPDQVSIPLKNCFIMAGANDVKVKIEAIKNKSSQRQDFAEHMGRVVTAHVNNVWKDHNVEIVFEITDTTITPRVRDKKDEQRSNRITPSSRSDGFKQMVSFILNISAENLHGRFTNTVLLLDEPETHVHPTGQEFLRDELAKISKNNNNLVIYATHTPYMVDRNNVSRVVHVYKVLGKDRTPKTKVKEIRGAITTFAEINYMILDIPTTDYHNELYGYLHSRFIDEAADDAEARDREHIGTFDKEFLKLNIVGTKTWTRYRGSKEDVSSSTYIRHCINHPEAASKHNSTYTKKELIESIKTLKDLKDQINSGNNPKGFVSSKAVTSTPTKAKSKP